VARDELVSSQTQSPLAVCLALWHSGRAIWVGHFIFGRLGALLSARLAARRQSGRMRARLLVVWPPSGSPSLCACEAAVNWAKLTMKCFGDEIRARL